MALRVEVTVRLVGPVDTPSGPVDDDVFGYSHTEYLPVLPDETPDHELATYWRDRVTEEVGRARNSIIAQAEPLARPPASGGGRPTGRGSHRARR